MGLRARLMWLVWFAAIPAFGIIGYTAINARTQTTAITLALLLIAALLAILATWIGSQIFYLRRLKALVDTAQRLRQGDLKARTGLPHDNEELGRLARSIDDMAGTLQHVHRALKTLSAGNRAMVRATDEQALLAEMCHIIVDVGSYKVAWIGFAEQDEHKTVRPVAQSGFGMGLDGISKVMADITWADTDRGRGAVGTAIRTAKPVIARDFPHNPLLVPWREEAARNGVGSVAAFPLLVQDKAIGALAIYSAEIDAFDVGEVELLEAAASDLAFDIAVLRTRAEHNRANATITHMAYYDSLTGLPNHAYFDESLKKAWTEAAVRNRSLALLVIGLKRFREINDALGFEQGDRLLKEVGNRIRGVTTSDALVARMRGHEFALLLSVSDEAEATRIAQQALEALGAPFSVNDLNLDVNAVVGISLFPQHGAELSHLVRHADVAMQQARKSERGFVFYSPEHEEDSTRRLSLAGELRHAIEGDQLVLYFQLKIDLLDGHVCGAEALVRWQHPERGLVPPDEFITLSEQTGLIKPLTDWVVNAALRQSSQWRRAGLALPIAVNLSARNLHDAELVPSMERLLSAWDAQAGWLEIEITEGAVMHDTETALGALRRLSAMGITLFIDDFGTGYSSLSYLNKLPVDAVKIDKSFVLNMLANADSNVIVRSTIGLAHDLNLKVVAEGVETQAMWNQLLAFRCDVAQGYFISKPLPADLFKEWLDQRATKKTTTGRTRRKLPRE